MGDKMRGKMYNKVENRFTREFRLFFTFLQVFGIEIPNHSSQTKTMEVRGRKLISSFNPYPRYVLIVIFFLASINGIIWIIVLPKELKKAVQTFLTLLKVFFSALIFKKRRAIAQITEDLRKMLNALRPQFNFRMEKWMCAVYFIFIQILFATWNIMYGFVALRRSEISEEFFKEMGFPSHLPFFCSLILVISEFCFSFITKFIILLFVIYYSLVCRVIRLLFGRILDLLRLQIFIQEHENLLDNYEKITKSMIKVDKALCFPTFVAITASMIELFWTGYRLAFRKYITNKYVVGHVCTLNFNLTFQLLIMISASMTNEMAKKAKDTLQCMKFRIPPDLRKTKLKEVCTKESDLTLWKIYVVDRSLLITSFGTLLTYGILIGTLGEES
ncbi:uncharacterized protein TNCT_228171 [Trichonephila clavata]|uniref:Uncharacterized protein n=1 Tax=Trichonephila clavata TaxID=2740835 RepID=A0A8X6KW16_TRICU|nr:uncharacterized protein TNCT_228171 [Trichonephila clavata]